MSALKKAEMLQNNPLRVAVCCQVERKVEKMEKVEKEIEKLDALSSDSLLETGRLAQHNQIQQGLEKNEAAARQNSEVDLLTSCFHRF